MSLGSHRPIGLLVYASHFIAATVVPYHIGLFAICPTLSKLHVFCTLSLIPLRIFHAKVETIVHTFLAISSSVVKHKLSGRSQDNTAHNRCS